MTLVSRDLCSDGWSVSPPAGPAAGFHVGGDYAVSYDYYPRQELTATAVQQPVGTPLSAQDRAYAYDPIGNRTESKVGEDDPLHYCANSVNQYEATAAAAGCATPEESFGYDDDGNLAYDGSLLYEWDGENRLKAAYVASPTTTDDKKVAFTYDYMSRRVRKQSLFWSTDHWQLTTDQRFTRRVAC
jgi:hypothetical protein